MASVPSSLMCWTTPGNQYPRPPKRASTLWPTSSRTEAVEADAELSATVGSSGLELALGFSLAGGGFCGSAARLAAAGRGAAAGGSGRASARATARAASSAVTKEPR
eukprot:scaffold69887_cov60-Phaeocystis_antarctica.AAC.1